MASREIPEGKRLSVDAGPAAQGAIQGSSLAVDGVCLTVCGIDGARLDFDVIAETLGRSTLGRLQVGQRVNLERPLRADGRIDGHFVQGHVDGTARVTRREASRRQWVLWFQPPAELVRFMIPKGSVAVSGISLTIASVHDAQFSVALIPTTLAHTTLGDLNVGDLVNVESDLLARTVVHALGGLNQSAGLTEDKLRAQGYS